SARDASDNVLTGYTGTVHFTSPDPLGATLPPDFTFTTADAGVHTFTNGVTLYTAGSQTVTVADTAIAGLTGSATVAVAPGPAASFYVDAPATVATGTPFGFTVYVLDAYGNLATNYTGQVGFFSTTDPLAQLPGPYTFTPTDGGVATFPGGATLFTEGLNDLWVYDTATFIAGVAYVSVVPGGAPGGAGGRPGAGPAAARPEWFTPAAAGPPLFQREWVEQSLAVALLAQRQSAPAPRD